MIFRPAHSHHSTTKTTLSHNNFSLFYSLIIQIFRRFLIIRILRWFLTIRIFSTEFSLTPLSYCMFLLALQPNDCVISTSRSWRTIPAKATTISRMQNGVCTLILLIRTRNVTFVTDPSGVDTSWSKYEVTEWSLSAKWKYLTRYVERDLSRHMEYTCVSRVIAWICRIPSIHLVGIDAYFQVEISPNTDENAMDELKTTYKRSLLYWGL